MPSASSTPGLPRRRTRLSDAETQERMLDAAVEVVNASGLTVSLEHISLEQVIRDAGVSRSAAYRKWPYKDLFFNDLLRELAKAARPAAVPNRAAAQDAIRRHARDHQDLLTTPQGRDQLAIELLRVGNAADVASTAASAEWRTFIALHATFLSLEDGDLRSDIAQSLAESERRLVTEIAGTFRFFTELLGYRLRPELELTHEDVARMGVPFMRGAVIMAPSMPELTRTTERGNPCGVPGRSEWSPAVLAMTTMAFGCLSPDPDVVWDDDRLAEVRAQIDAAA